MSQSEPVVVRVPKLYENMDEATIGEWLAKEGDELATDSPLVELVTDKTIQELAAPAPGVLRKQFATQRSVLPVGAVLAVIGGPAEQDWSVHEAANAKLADEALQAAGLAIPAPAPAAAKKTSKPRIAPAARALAKKNNVDMDALAAAVGDRVIHKKDVQAFIQRAAGPSSPSSSDPQAKEASPAAAATGSNGTLAAEATGSNGTLAAEATGSNGTLASGTLVGLVTGASGAMGIAIAKRLAKDGYAIAAHYRSNADAANELVRELRDSGVEAAAFQADLADGAAAAQLAEAVLAKFGRIDALINNAGALDDAVLAFMSDDQWRNVIAANLDSAFYLTRAVAMPMARNRGGRIVNIASAAGRIGGAGRANYAAAKAGLVGLTKSAAREFAASKVRVNAISPGFVETAMTADIPDAKRKTLLREIPARRFGKPEEIAELVAYLCSPLADYVTGQEISIDGGLFIG